MNWQTYKERTNKHTQTFMFANAYDVRIDKALLRHILLQ